MGAQEEERRVGEWVTVQGERRESYLVYGIVGRPTANVAKEIIGNIMITITTRLV